MKTDEAVVGRKLKLGAQKGDKQSNGLHALKLAYEAKKERQLAGVKSREILRAQMTSFDQMEVLDDRLGEFIGAKKERARLDLKDYDEMSSSGRVYYPANRAQLVRNLEVAKMESRGYRIMRQLGLASLTIAEYEEAKYAAQYAA